MADISIPKSLAQMDGIFGCKVVCQADTTGKKSFSFQQKNFFEWVCDVLFDLHLEPFTSPHVLTALDEIAEKIKDAETGAFKKLVDSYRGSGAKIDFREIRKTLEASLLWEFPPRVFVREEFDSSDLTLISAYKDVHRKNMKKGEYLEKETMPLISNSEYDKVTDANIRGYCELLYPTYLDRTAPLIVPLRPEKDEKIYIRIQLMATKIDEENEVPICEDRGDEILELAERLALLQTARPVGVIRNFKEAYLQKIVNYLQEIVNSVSPDCCALELLVESNGNISEENIAGFVEAIIHLENLEKEKGFDSQEAKERLLQLKNIVCEASVPAGVIEESTDVQYRLMNAYLKRRNE